MLWVIGVEVIRYKDLRETFFKDTVFYSRSSAFRAGCPGKADVVKVHLDENTESGSSTYSVFVRAELQNHVDYLRESLIKLGYTCDEENQIWTKTVRVSYKKEFGSLQLLKDTVKVIDDLIGELPVYLYESSSAKRLRAYVTSFPELL